MNALSAIKPGLKNMATRITTAENNFIEVLINLGGITKAEAEKALATFRKLKLVKMDAVNGVLSVKHGAYLSKDAIRNAVSF